MFAVKAINFYIRTRINKCYHNEIKILQKIDAVSHKYSFLCQAVPLITLTLMPSFCRKNRRRQQWAWSPQIEQLFHLNFYMYILYNWPDNATRSVSAKHLVVGSAFLHCAYLTEEQIFLSFVSRGGAALRGLEICRHPINCQCST